MANKHFKILSALSLLLLYLWVVVGGNVSLILCDCHSHHTVISEHCCLQGDSHHCTPSSLSVESECGCTHNHTAGVELYTLSRGGNDDVAAREILLLVAFAEASAKMEAACGERAWAYGVYLLRPLLAVVKGCVALRAPPAVV